MADGPQFGMFVRSVPGHVVQRYGSTELIGATRRPLTKHQKLDGESPIAWNDTIVPLTKDFCRRYARELDGHLREKELVTCTREEWEAQQADAQARIEAANTPLVVAAESPAEAAPEVTDAGPAPAPAKAPSAGKRSK